LHKKHDRVSTLAVTRLQRFCVDGFSADGGLSFMCVIDGFLTPRAGLGLFLIFTLVLEEFISTVVGDLLLPFACDVLSDICTGVRVISIITLRAVVLVLLFVSFIDFVAARRGAASVDIMDGNGPCKSDAARRSDRQCAIPNDLLVSSYVASWLSYGDPNARHTCGVGRRGIVGAGGGGIHGVFGGDDTVLNDLNALLNF
jgi:hypothetical protein